jgi:radical SAM superfamily enzyme YgiQ (UPF0313 family)
MARSLKVLLIRPRDPKDSIGLSHFIRCDPIELAAVAAGVDPRHEVRIFDSLLDRGLPGVLRTFEPDVVGTSCYINGVNEVARLLEGVRRAAPEALTVVGGVHATCNPDDFLTTGPDAIVRGEGATGFGRLVEAYASSGRGGLAGLEGVSLRAEGGFEHGPDTAWPDPNDIRFPRRELYERHWPRYYYVYHDPCGLMKASYGCPYRCSFCYCWKVTGGTYRYRSAESFVDELERLWFPEVYLVDDDFFLHAERLVEIHDRIRRRGIRKGFFAYGRADFIARNPELVRMWSEIGLKAVVVGVESFRRNELDYYGKCSDEDDNARAFEVLRRARVDVYASFILGPDWELRDFEELQSYLFRHRIYYCVLQPLMPLPGTEIWEEWKDRVILDRDHHELWDISHLCLPSRLPMARYYREMTKLYLRTVADPRRIRDLRPRTIEGASLSKVARTLWGSLRLLWGLGRAPRRYRPSELARFAAGVPRPIGPPAEEPG